MADPVAVVKSIYAQCGDELDAAQETAMRNWMRDNPQGKHGSHDYALAEYGLERQGVLARFESYIDRFGLSTD